MNRRRLLAAAIAAIAALPLPRGARADEAWAPHEEEIQVIPLASIKTITWPLDGRPERFVVYWNHSRRRQFDVGGLFQREGDEHHVARPMHITDEWWEFRYL